MSRYLEVEILESSRFSDLVLLCWQRRWPLLVSMELGSHFLIDDSVRLGQDLK